MYCIDTDIEIVSDHLFLLTVFIFLESNGKNLQEKKENLLSNNLVPNYLS